MPLTEQGDPAMYTVQHIIEREIAKFDTRVLVGLLLSLQPTFAGIICLIVLFTVGAILLPFVAALSRSHRAGARSGLWLLRHDVHECGYLLRCRTW